MRFRHFIITRFNVNIHPEKFIMRLNDNWLYERFDFFSRFCLPSIAAQEEQNFTWIILFDEDTPAHFKKMINVFEKYSNINVIYCGDFSTVMPRVKSFITESSAGYDYILTTRLDNDDALSRKFVSTLHNVVGKILGDGSNSVSELYINFPNGYQYCNGDVYDFADITNAFVSLLETNRTLHTVYWVDHPSIYDKAPVAQVETKPIYLQNVHDGNVYNYIRGQKIGGAELLNDFSLEL
ncbi:glycosyltransferase [Maridesulfovibrio sp. FT414]|uniref:glycosyltransferase n=1 Tax=Maridesulfovibrio sp. FT414 TaxID=2979469 RepID=UPI003D8057EE